jgi:hypothetical protein
MRERGSVFSGETTYLQQASRNEAWHSVRRRDERGHQKSRSLLGSEQVVKK